MSIQYKGKYQKYNIGDAIPSKEDYVIKLKSTIHAITAWDNVAEESFATGEVINQGDLVIRTNCVSGKELDQGVYIFLGEVITDYMASFMHRGDYIALQKVYDKNFKPCKSKSLHFTTYWSMEPLEVYLNDIELRLEKSKKQVETNFKLFNDFKQEYNIETRE